MARKRKSDADDQDSGSPHYRITTTPGAVWFFGELSDTAASELLEYVFEVSSEMRDGEPILIGIYSLGGDASAGLALKQPFARLQRPIHTMAVGEVHSAAVDLFMLGTVRIMDKHAMLVVHQPYETGDAEHMNDKRISLEGLKLSVKLTIDHFAAVSGLGKTKISSMLRAGAVLDAQKALKFGFATEIR